MNTGNLRDTMLGLQQAQIEREKRLRASERSIALKVVHTCAQQEGWPEEEIQEVIGMLGLYNDAR